MIKDFYEMSRNVMIVHDDKEKGFGDKKYIDVWWGGLKGNGGLMMMVAYLLNSSRAWWDAEVRLKMVVDSEKAAEDAHNNLTNLIEKARTGATPEIIVSNGRSFNTILHESSSDADLILLGMAKPDENFTAYYSEIQERLKGLPTTLLILAAEEISFGDVLMQNE